MEDGSEEEVVRMESGANHFPNGWQNIYFEMGEEVEGRADEEVPIDFIYSANWQRQMLSRLHLPFQVTAGQERTSRHNYVLHKILSL